MMLCEGANRRWPDLRKVVSALVMLGVIVVFTLIAGNGRTWAGDPIVKIDNFTFEPETLTVPVGATVTWENQDDIPHTVVASNQLFRSKALDTGDKHSVTFTAPGEIEYFCGLHPHMKGKIIVTP